MSVSRFSSSQGSVCYLGNLPNGDVVFCAHGGDYLDVTDIELWSDADAKRQSAKLAVASAVDGSLAVLTGQLCASFTALFLPDAKYSIRLQVQGRVQETLSVAFKKKANSASTEGVKALVAVSDALDMLVSRQSAPRRASPPAAAPVISPAPSFLPTNPPVSTELAEPTEQVVKPAYYGSIDGVIDSRIEGWFWNASEPDVRYEIQAWSEGHLVAYGLANRYRPDLENKGKGDGRVKFEITLSPLVQDGNPHSIQLMVLADPATSRILTLGPPVSYISKSKVKPKASETLLMRLASLRQRIQDIMTLANATVREARVKEVLAKLALHTHEQNVPAMRQNVDDILAHAGPSLLTDLLRAFVHECASEHENALALYRKASLPLAQMAWVQLAFADNARLAGKSAEALERYRLACQLEPAYSNEVAAHVSKLGGGGLADSAKVSGAATLWEKIASNPDNRDLTRQLFDAQLSKSGNRFNLVPNAVGESADLRHWRLVLESKVESRIAQLTSNT